MIVHDNAISSDSHLFDAHLLQKTARAPGRRLTGRLQDPDES